MTKIPRKITKSIKCQKKKNQKRIYRNTKKITREFKNNKKITKSKKNPKTEHVYIYP